jgi:hypothetical protein
MVEARDEPRGCQSSPSDFRLPKGLL